MAYIYFCQGSLFSIVIACQKTFSVTLSWFVGKVLSRKGSNVFKMVIKTSNRSRVVLIDLEVSECHILDRIIILVVYIVLVDNYNHHSLKTKTNVWKRYKLKVAILSGKYAYCRCSSADDIKIFLPGTLVDTIWIFFIYFPLA